MKLNKIIVNIYLTIIFFYSIFGRSFSGINILGFKLGEILVAICLLFSVFYFPVGLFKKFETNFIFDKKVFIISKLFLASFLLSIFFSNGDLTNTYSYRSSSIIWTVNFLFIGYFIFNNSEENNLFYKLIPFLPIFLYILSTIHFPNVLIVFFNNFSDKFDFVKGSDLLLVFVLTMLFVRERFEKSLIGLSYFLIISSLYLPLFLYKSKGAFFPGILFVIFNLLFYKGFIAKNIFKTLGILFISSLVFLASTFNSYGNLTFKKLGMDGVSQPDNIIVAVPDAFDTIVNEKNTSEIFASFYIYKGRLYSQEQMANWRLQIWQDVIRDLFWNANYYQDPVNFGLVREQLDRTNDRFLTGFGYNEILPSMNHWERQGNDGSNENPHNFLVYALGRGGLLLGLLVVAFHILLLIFWFKKYRNFQILYFILPVLFAAGFDAAMESVRYPLIYYSFFGYFIKKGINK